MSYLEVGGDGARAGLSVPLNFEKLVLDLRAARRASRKAGTQAVRTRDLPSPPVIETILRRLNAALFPRHRGAHDDVEAGVDYFVGHNLAEALRDLREQIARELRFTGGSMPLNETAISSAAASIANDFATTLPRLYGLIASDIQAAYEGDPSAKSTEEVLLSFPGVRAVIYYRLAHELYRLNLPILARIISELAHSATGIDIHPGATIGGRFFIDHGTGVVIGETAVIGERVRLYQAVTLGAKRFSFDDSGALLKGEARHPIVEDDVVIYAGATILGRVTIGKGSTIGGNVWLTRSVPPGSHVMQAQARSEIFDSGGGI